MNTSRQLLTCGTILSLALVSPALAGNAGVSNINDIQPGLVIQNPDEAIPPQDYPAASFRAGEEGAVTFKLSADASGKVLDCQITATSGIKALDDQTCLSVRSHGKFTASGAPDQADGRYSMTQTVHWTIPTAGPRALFMGVTLASSLATPDGRVRCAFSDGLIQFVAKATSCVLNTGTQSIVEHYQQLYKDDQKSEYAFNAAVVLAAQQYGQSVDYLVKASDSGLGLASFVMCGLNATPNNTLMNVYDPKEAVRRCLLAHEQGFDLGIVLIRQFLTTHPDAASADQRQFITTYQPSLPIVTSDAVLTVPPDAVVRRQDYPKDELKHKVQGRTVALYRIGAEGRVQECLIIQSSLSYALDETVCRRLREAAIYTPATLLGQPTVVWKTQAVTWQVGRNDNALGGTIFGALLGAIVGHAM